MDVIQNIGMVYRNSPVCNRFSSSSAKIPQSKIRQAEVVQ